MAKQYPLASTGGGGGSRIPGGKITAGALTAGAGVAVGRLAKAGVDTNKKMKKTKAEMDKLAAKKKAQTKKAK